LAIWEELGDLGSQAVLLNNLGAHAYYQGQWDVALDHYVRGRDLNLRIGNLADAAVGNCNVAEILVDQGRLDDAEPMLVEASEMFTSLGYTVAVAFATRHLGRIAVKRGDLDRAVGLLDEARRTFADHGMAAKVLEVDAWLAECMLRRGAVDDALALLDDTSRREVAGGDTTFTPMLHRLRAYAYAAQDRLADAWAEVDHSLHAASTRSSPFDVALALEALAVMAQLGGLPADPSGEAERASLLADLGVCATPPPPLAELTRAG
jgi:ATP/maltotriose-dependent transcriptional regulator MalT